MINLRHRTIRSIFAIVLALILTVMFVPINRNVYAAGGNLTIALSDIEGVGDDFPGLTFDLYAVGEYEGSSVKLYPEYEDAKVTIPSDDDQEAWLDAASKLANCIKHPADGQKTPDPVTTFENVMPGESMTYASDKNGMYLLISKTTKHDNARYKAVPVLVGVINGDASYSIDAEVKIEIAPITLEHSVIKTWDDEENKDGVRPETIEVGIYYGDQLIDRITLGGDEGVWTYRWESEETGDAYYYIYEKDGEEVRKAFEPDESDDAWGVREFTKASQISDEEAKAEAENLIYYEPEYSSKTSKSLELFMINNPYNPPEPPEPPEPPKPTPPEPPTPTPPKPPKVNTGDTNQPLVWGGIAGGACILLAGFAIARKKKKDEE